MKPVEIREKTTKELNTLLGNLEQEVFNTKFKLGGGQLKNTSYLKKKRHDIARIKTILCMRNKEEQTKK